MLNPIRNRSKVALTIGLFASLSLGLTACGTTTTPAETAPAPAQTQPAAPTGTEPEAPAEVEEPAEPANPIAALGHPQFDALSFSGTGDDIIELPENITAGMVHATYNGSGHFAITGLDANNDFADLLVNTIGNYDGTTAFGVSTILPAGERLQVSASGDWTMTVSSLNDAPELPEAGTGNGVFAYTGPATTWSITHDGSSNFSVIQYGSGMLGMNLLVNEIGNYEGRVAPSAGPSIVVISADGNWTID